MKTALGVIVGIVLLLGIYAMRAETIKYYANKQISKAEQMAETQRNMVKVDAEVRRSNEKVKMLVRAKDVRTCMKDLYTEVIDNLVIECNKDHYIELTRAEAEKLKELRK